jgi:hypothetical protein
LHILTSYIKERNRPLNQSGYSIYQEWKMAKFLDEPSDLIQEREDVFEGQGGDVKPEQVDTEVAHYSQQPVPMAIPGF